MPTPITPNETIMNKLIERLRTNFATGGAERKLSKAAAHGIPGFLKIDVRYSELRSS